jgi:hypothetical protein
LNQGLRSQVADFSVEHASIVEAVLTLGEQQHVCFGIEYVDRHSLIDPITVTVKNVTTERALSEILSHGKGYSFKEMDGVVLITNVDEPHGNGNLFDHIVPQFATPRATVQDVSNALWMQIRVDLDPKITGFAGHYPAGNTEDFIDAIHEDHRSVRQILNLIVGKSKGASWVAAVGPGALSDVSASRLWLIVEYDRPIAEYANRLTEIGKQIRDNTGHEP